MVAPNQPGSREATTLAATNPPTKPAPLGSRHTNTNELAITIASNPSSAHVGNDLTARSNINVTAPTSTPANASNTTKPGPCSPGRGSVWTTNATTTPSATSPISRRQPPTSFSGEPVQPDVTLPADALRDGEPN